MFSLSNPIVKNLLSTLVKDAKKKDLKGYVLFFDEKGEAKTAELKKGENVYSTDEIEKVFAAYEKAIAEIKKQKTQISDLEYSGRQKNYEIENLKKQIEILTPNKN